VSCQAHQNALDAENYSWHFILLCLEPKFKQLRDGAFVSLGEYWAHIHIIAYWGDNVELFMRTYIDVCFR
jgi:hypothetical protein